MALIAIAIYDTFENNRAWMTAETLRSLERTVDFSRHRITLVVNAATEQTVEAIAQFGAHCGEALEVFYLESNVGTARAINKAWKFREPGEVLVKMDNDVVIHERGWLDTMEEAIRKDSKIGIIGLKRKDCCQHPNHPDPFYRSTLHFVPEVPHGGRWIVVERTADVMGTCTAFNPALVDQIGGLYQPGLYGFDDVLACVRSLKAGFYNCFLHGVEIDHIDPGQTAYQGWKEKRAGVDSPEYHRLKSGYESGEIPLFVPFDYSLTLQEYKGYTIKVDTYLGENESGNNFFFEIEKDGKFIYSTLLTDDKMWTRSSGMEAAKKYIDEMEK